jgi:hypothetical protein
MSDAVVIIHLQRSERPDSLELGTPGKGGAIKVFMDCGEPEEAERRIRTAFRLREIGQDLRDRQDRAGREGTR